MPRVKQPWYRWQFSLPLALWTALFAWLAWDSIADADAHWHVRIMALVIWGGLTLWFARDLWRYRKPFQFEVGSSKREQNLGRER